MANNVEHSAILPMSDPTDSGPRSIRQANNVFAFPGTGLGTIVSSASEILDGMISAATTSLNDCLNEADIRERVRIARWKPRYPDIESIP